MTIANTVPQEFHAGDRVQDHIGRVGVVVGDIFWGRTTIDLLSSTTKADKKNVFLNS